MVRISWVHPDIVESARSTLLRGRPGWDVLFGDDDVLYSTGAPPPTVAVTAEAWPRLATHVARAERVRAHVGHEGLESATRRFGASRHAVERAALLENGDGDDVAAVAGVLECEVDELLAYGHFLSRLVELGAGVDPEGTVARYEAFVAAASRVVSGEASWPERVRVARDGLAALYVRVGRAEAAEALYGERYEEEPGDTTIAIGAARAFLEAGDVRRAVVWLDRATERAEALGRDALAARLRQKIDALRARLN